MYKLELLDLVRKSNSAEEYELTKLTQSLSNIIKENSPEILEFIQTQNYSPKEQEFIQKAYELSQNEESTSNNLNESQNQQEIEQETPQSDLDLIKNSYYNWYQEYSKENKVNGNCSQIVENILSRFEQAKPKVLFDIFEMDLDSNFELFKNHIKNRLRVHFGDKIKKYLDSDEFKNTNFLSRHRKKLQIKKLLNQLEEYKFDFQYLKEVLE